MSLLSQHAPLLCSAREAKGGHRGNGEGAQKQAAQPLCYNCAMEDTQQGEERAHAPVMTPALCTTIANRYHLSLSPARRLSGGEECEIWLATFGDGLVLNH